MYFYDSEFFFVLNCAAYLQKRERTVLKILVFIAYVDWYHVKINPKWYNCFPAMLVASVIIMWANSVFFSFFNLSLVLKVLQMSPSPLLHPPTLTPSSIPPPTPGLHHRPILFWPQFHQYADLTLDISQKNCYIQQFVISVDLTEFSKNFKSNHFLFSVVFPQLQRYFSDQVWLSSWTFLHSECQTPSIPSKTIPSPNRTCKH